MRSGDYCWQTDWDRMEPGALSTEGEPERSLVAVLVSALLLKRDTMAVATF